MAWKPMKTAPKDRAILVRRHNDVTYEYDIVWWDVDACLYPWISNSTAYPVDRLDDWHSIPR
jgi:hypothetical protein